MATTDMKHTMDAAAFTEANRAYFDQLAAKYTEKPWQQKMVADTANEITNNLDFIGANWVDKSSGKPKEAVRLLDYACGTGCISTVLAPYITSTTGLDISVSMINKFHENLAVAPNTRNHFSPPRAYLGNILSDTPAEAADAASKELQIDLELPELYDFDIAVIGMGLHHFAEPDKAIRRLGRRLKKGGVLLIIDFIAGDNHGSDSHGHAHHDHHHSHTNGHSEGPDAGWKNTAAAHTIQTHGFSREDMQRLFADAATHEDPKERVVFENYGWVEYEKELEMQVPAKKGTPEADRGEEITLKRRGFLAKAQRAD